MTSPFTKAITLLALLCPGVILAQQKALVLPLAYNTEKNIEQIRIDPEINTDSAITLLTNWSCYPRLEKTGCDYQYYFKDTYYGTIPLHVYIPSSYKSSSKNPCIMMLHGAVGQSKFSDIDSTSPTDEDVLFDILKKQNYVVIRPLGDSKKQFDWVVNRFDSWREQHANLTYKALNNILISLKSILNIDDNRVFALGHSDGADGATGLAVYSPDMYAGVVGYNSMLTNLRTRDFFIKNVINRQVYFVHSELDDLRPMRTTREIIDQLKANGARIAYKEYPGFQHYDKHLSQDLPSAITYINGIKRNPYQPKLEWTTVSDTIYNVCDWLVIDKIDTIKPKAGWDREFNLRAYDKKTGNYYPTNYYYYAENHVSVKAKYADNVFDLQCSRVGGVQLLISPAMINIRKPIIVNVNGKKMFEGLIKADKNFLLKKFTQTLDRQALWVNSINVKVD
jgi:predicted esterase